MVGLLSAASSVLGGATGGGGLSDLTGGGGTDASSASTTVTQTFSTGSMGGSDNTALYLILAVVALYVLTTR